MSGEEGFLSRWSRLKREGSQPEEPAPIAEAKAEEEAPPPPDLPPVESLGKESDYSAFLQAGVPAALRREALRRLWTTDPVLAAPEALDLHMGDYTGGAAEVVASSFKLPEVVKQASQPAAEPEPQAEAVVQDEGSRPEEDQA